MGRYGKAATISSFQDQGVFAFCCLQSTPNWWCKGRLKKQKHFFCCQLWIIVQLNYMFVIGGHTISYLHYWKCSRFHSFYQINVNLSCTLGRQPLFKPCYIIVLCYLVLMSFWLNFKLLLQQAEKTVVLLSKLAKVVAQEKLVLEHCLELLRTISTLEVRYKH